MENPDVSNLNNPPAAAPAAPPPLAPPLSAPAAPPPLVGSSVPARPARAGRGWKVLSVVLLLLLILSGIGNVRHLLNDWLSMGSPPERARGSRLIEAVMEDNDAEEKIAVVDVAGIITSGFLEAGSDGMVSLIRQQLKRAGEDADVKAVLLRVSTPGGEVLAADEIYRLLAEFQDKTRKPVIASMGNVAASGGYYVSAPCRWIVANELTITGSIGVIMHGYNYRGLMDKVGLRPEVFKSGKLKDMMSPDKAEAEILPEERRLIQTLVDEAFARFKKIVAEGRQFAHEKNKSEGRKLASNWEEFADGRVLSGRQACDLGFVDELGNFRTALERTLRLTGLTKANLVQYHQPFELANLFRLFGQTESRTVKLDLGVDLPRLRTGLMYYLFLPGVR